MSNRGKATQYRPEIDGLRAIAVLAVIAFHGFPEFFPGGFVGVDVFFVISGYLITRLLADEIRHSKFNLADFYSRRIRRIFPSLVVVLLACLVIGWGLLLTDEFSQLGKHIAGSAIFSSNFILWSESGYFDNASDTKPLMHLWSLGIEEQFYLFFPLLLYLAYKLRRPRAFLIMLAAASFLANIFAASSEDAFFLPWTRFWELAIGGILAEGVFANWRKHIGWAPAGLFFVLLASFYMDKTFSFPGWWALLPVLGAGFVVFAEPTNLFSQKILAQPVLVGIGLISYPLYLWHWPLLAFARISLGGTPSIAVRSALIFISFLLAWATYLFVEKYFRRHQRTFFKVSGLCIAMLFIGLSGLLVYNNGGLPARKVVQMNSSLESARMGAGLEGLTISGCGLPTADEKLFSSCKQDSREKPIYGLVGDSKALALFPGLVRESTTNQRWLLISEFLPISSSEQIYKEDQPGTKTVLQNINVNTIVFAMSARKIFHLPPESDHDISSLANSPYEEVARQGLDASISSLLKQNKRVIFVVDNPTLPPAKDCAQNGRLTAWPILNSVLGTQPNAACMLPFAEHVRRTEKYRDLVTRLKRDNPGLEIFDPSNLVCDVATQTCPAIMNGQHLYSFTDHYSDYGNTLVARGLIHLIQGKSEGN